MTSGGNPAAGDLKAAATAAGLLDLDLLPLARTGLAPAEAVADLRRRFPGFFRNEAIPGSASPKRVQDMTPEERRAAFKAIGVRLG